MDNKQQLITNCSFLEKVKKKKRKKTREKKKEKKRKERRERASHTQGREKKRVSAPRVVVVV